MRSLHDLFESGNGKIAEMEKMVYWGLGALWTFCQEKWKIENIGIDLDLIKGHKYASN